MIIKPNNNLPSGMFYEKSLICERRNLNTVKVKEFSLTAAIYNEALRSITTFLAGQIGIGDLSPDHDIDVAGNIGMDAGGYLNYGDTDGATGYGVRDHGGALEYKDSGGNILQNYWRPGDNGGANPYWTINKNLKDIEPTDNCDVYSANQCYSSLESSVIHKYKTHNNEYK